MKTITFTISDNANYVAVDTEYLNKILKENESLNERLARYSTLTREEAIAIQEENAELKAKLEFHEGLRAGTLRTTGYAKFEPIPESSESIPQKEPEKAECDVGIDSRFKEIDKRLKITEEKLKHGF